MNKQLPSQLIVIDPTVADIPKLLQQLPSNSKAVSLTNQTDQIDQISTLLQQYQGLEALHIVTHGSPGILQFSNTILSCTTLNRYKEQLANWSISMADDADILLYGCETAQGITGQQFINALSLITQRCIIGAETRVGHTDLGGSWDLTRTSQEKSLPVTVFTSDTAKADWAFTLTVADEDYEDDSTGATTSNDGWDYSSNDSAATGIESPPYASTKLSGKVYVFNSSGPNNQTQVSIKTTDGTEFKLNSFDIGRGPGTFANLIIKGYRDNVEVATSTPGYGTNSNDGHTFDVSSDSDWQNIDEIRFLGDDLGIEIDNIDVSDPVLPGPTISSATYDASTGNLVVTGTNFIADGGGDDVIANKFTITGEGGETYTLTDTPNVEITSATEFTLALSATDQAAVEQILNKNGTTSSGSTTYDIDAAAGFMAASASTTDTDANGITVSNIPAPAITSATYDYSNGQLIVTGTGFVKQSGATNDIDVTKLSITGEGGGSYTLTGSSVEITNGTSFTVTLSGTDLLHVNGLMSANGLTAASGTTYNLNAAEDWAAGADAAVNVADATGNGITVSSYTAPAITSVIYNANTGQLVVAGTNFVSASGATNDVDVSLLTFTGEGGSGEAYTLTSASDVEITSRTSFTVMLSGDDLLHVNGLMSQNGSTAADSTAYNLAAADNWMTGAPASADTTLATNGITVSGYNAPTIDSATYDFSNGQLVVTGANFVKKAGVTNDIDISLLTLTGEAGSTYTLTSASDVEITSATEFMITLSGDDLTRVEALLNKDGTNADSNTAYNLAAADNWLAAAPASADITDSTATISVSNYNAPAIISSTYDWTSGNLVLTGTNFVSVSGSNNDVDVTKLTITGEGGVTYTLTTSNVDITSDTSITVTLNDTDQLNVEGLLTKNGTQADDGATNYNLAAAEDWMLGSASGLTVADSTTGITVSSYTPPSITGVAYDYGNGQLVVTGSNFVKRGGATNDIDISTLTFTGEGGATHTIASSSDVEVTSATSFTVTLSGNDLLLVNSLMSKDGTQAADGATSYNLAAADNWLGGAPGNSNIASATNAITVSNYAAPDITSATYDYSNGQLVVTGTGFVKKSGATNDVDVSLLTLTGEGGNSYTLTSGTDVEVTSATEFTITLSGDDLTRVEALLNKDGTSADSGTVYNIAAADNWMTGAPASTDIADMTSNGVTVSHYEAPTITSSAYDWSTGQLVLTGTNFVSVDGSNNDIDVTKFTVTGENNGTYTLTTSNVDITSDTTATITLSADDQLNVHGLLNKNGLQADDGATTYNLAAAEDWMSGAASTLIVADTTTGINVSHYAAPTLTSATYDSDTGELVVTGTNFVKSPGSANDIDISTITITGESGSFAITSTADVEITSDTSFTITLSGADKTGVDTRLDQLGTSSSGGTTYNITVLDNWLAGAPPSADISDNTAHTVTVQISPKITSASYDASTGDLVVTGTNIQAKTGVNNDIDASTFTITGEGGQTYTLIGTPDVERTSSTAFTLQLDAADKAAVNLLLNKNGTASTGGTTFNLAAGDDWNTEVTAGDISDATNAITVSSVPVPAITYATYDASTGSLVVTGSGFLQSDGTTNDIDVSKLSLSGEGSESYTLTSNNVEIDSATSFTVNLNATDQAAVALFLNKDGTASTSGTTYNLAAAEDWAAGADAAVTVADLTGNGVTVSHTPTPTITSATYNGTTGVLVVTGTSFLKKGGTANDIDITRLTITGEGGGTHTLTSDNVDITSATEFTVTLNAADQTAVANLLNKAGTTANGGTTYNLNAAEDWAAGADAAINVVDATGNGITVTLNSAPTSADATQSTDYNSSYTFQVSDFAFSDTDSGDTLQGITIRTLPVEGDLYLNSTAITAVDTTVTLAELSAGNLIFTPDNGGTGDNYASFTFTVNDGSDDSVATNTMTLNVGAAPTSNPTPTPAPTPTPTPTPTPEPEPETVDGVTINREQETNAQGDSITVIRVDPVPQDRQDTDATTTQADLPLHFADDEAQQVVTRISLPNGVGVQARANEDARTHNQNLDLVELIRETAGTRESDNEDMQALGQDFLDQLGDSREQVWVNQINLEQSNNRDNEDEPIILTGSPDDNDQGYQEAIVINMRQLPSGTQLVLNDIEFAVIVGEDKVIRGGDGANTVFAGAGSQDIVLGADDDELHGGAGNDIVGSKGGNDLLNGDDGDDLVVGGFGHDTLNGGDGNDQLQGGQQEAGQFTFSLNDEGEIVTHYTPDSTDLSDVGAASFTGDWYSTPVYLDEHAHTQSILMTEDNRDNVENLNVILQAGEHYAFMAEDPARLKAIAVLYTAVVGERPDLSVLNHYATGDQSLSELSDLALSYWRTQKSIDEHTATDTQVRAVLDTFWSFGYLTQENIATAIDQINQGGSWSELFLQTAQHANSDVLLKNDTGTLQLAKTEHVDDHGISWDVGHDQLDGGAGDDILIGGHGNDQLIGGEGYDTARQLRKTSDYDIKLNEDGLITLVYQNGIYQETDALQGVEQVAFADALINFSATNLEGNELKLLTTLSQLVTGEALDLELLNQYQSGDLSQSQLVNNLMSTEGYLQQWSTLDNYQFVEQITETVFGQPLDTPDLAYWANRLDTDLSRAEGFELIATHQDYQDQLQQAGQLLIG